MTSRRVEQLGGEILVHLLEPDEPGLGWREEAWDQMPHDPSVRALFELGSFRPAVLAFRQADGWDLTHVRALLAQHGIELEEEKIDG